MSKKYFISNIKLKSVFLCFIFLESSDPEIILSTLSRWLTTRSEMSQRIGGCVLHFSGQKVIPPYSHWQIEAESCHTTAAHRGAYIADDTLKSSITDQKSPFSMLDSDTAIFLNLLTRITFLKEKPCCISYLLYTLSMFAYFVMSFSFIGLGNEATPSAVQAACFQTAKRSPILKQTSEIIQHET